MDNYQIFISYRRDGGDALAGRLSDRLSALGYKVFFDVESMRSGQFNTQILEAIAQCEDVLIILPPHALDRCVDKDDWVRQELAFALKHNKMVIPILMRGFEFPAWLPADIDNVRNMEGVTASSEYFDAVVEKIERLLRSSAAKFQLSNLKLEVKEYYKIFTPLFNIYKQNISTPKGFLKIAIFLEKLCQRNRDFCFCSYLGSKEGDVRFDSLRDAFDFMGKEKAVKWYDKNSDRIKRLREVCLVLKRERDLYFYNNVLGFAMGCMVALPKDFLLPKAWEIIEAFCYCVDLPYEEFEAFENAYREGNYAYEEFRRNLPLAIDVWGNWKKTGRSTASHTESFDANAILMFDFMVELSILILDTCMDSELTAIRTSQIRCYYKWLKKNKVFLPKEIQEKIYRFL